MGDTILGNLVWRITGNTTDFDKKLKSSEDSLTRFSKKANKVGNDLSLKLTAPILGLTAIVGKAGISFEKVQKKFGTAFRGDLDAASESVKDLRDNFGFSSTEATKLLANTGDLLKGFGATSSQALSLSERTQELTAALSAYNENGLTTSQVSEIATKALFGETEGFKQVGIVLRQADVEQRLFEKGQKDLTGQALLLAKAEATLELAYEQSSDAISSFAENQSLAAFKSGQALSKLQDISTELGTILLPLVNEALDLGLKIIDGFSNLSEEGKKTVLVIAGITAAIGPLAKLLAVATGPGGWLFLAVTVIGGLTAAVIKATEESREWSRLLEQQESITNRINSGIAETVSEFLNLSEKTNLTNEEQERYKKLATELKDLLPELTNENINNKEAVLAQAKAYQELNKQTALKTLEALKNQLAPLQQEFDKAVRLQQETLVRYAAIDTSLEFAKKSVLDLNPALSLTAEKILVLNEKIGETENALLKAESEIKNIDVQLKEYTKNTDKNTKTITENNEKKIEQLEITKAELEQNKLLFEARQQGLEIEKEIRERGDAIAEAEARKKVNTEIEKQIQANKKAIIVRQQELDLIRNLKLNSQALEAQKIKEAEESYKANQVYIGLTQGLYDLLGQTIKNQLGTALKAIGAALITQSEGFSRLKEAALNAIGAILDAVGTQLISQGIAALLVPGQQAIGAIAIAAGAAAKIAAGALGAARIPAPSANIPSIPRQPTFSQPAIAAPVRPVISEPQIPATSGRNITINIGVNADTRANIEKAVEVLYPYFKQEEIRRG